MIPRWRRYHFSRPPKLLRQAKLDNLALVPASLLPVKEAWQSVANSLPQGSVLICVPAQAQDRQRRTLETVATLLGQHGFHVTTMPAERFAAA